MLRLLWDRMPKEDKGFTLVELLVVIVILGVLVGIGVPTYRGFIDRSHEAATLAELQAVSMTIKYYFMEHGEGSFKLSELGRYLGTDFKAHKSEEGKYLYLDYTLTVESEQEQEYIFAKTDNSKRKNARIYIDESRRGEIEIKDPSEGT